MPGSRPPSPRRPRCLLCRQPIRKQPGHESRPDTLACWTHVTGSYQCAGSTSEFDLATFDPNEALRDDLQEETPPEDYCI